MNLKEKLKSGLPVVGTWLTLPVPAVSEIVSKAGFDWASIDMEHSCLSLAQCQELIRTLDLCGTSPLVRLSSNDAIQIKRIMDAGAHGVIVPMVNTLEDVKKAHQAMHYPPVGNRGVGLARAQKYGADFKGYWEWQKNNSLLIVQIEHKNALENLDEIFASQLMDAYMIGPYDLSASLGVPGEFDHPKVTEALELIEKKANQHKITKGVHIVEMDPALLEKNLRAGYKFIAYGVDFRVLEKNFRQAHQIFREMSRG